MAIYAQAPVDRVAVDYFVTSETGLTTLLSFVCTETFPSAARLTAKKSESPAVV
jgi:hypothetical protein